MNKLRCYAIDKLINENWFENEHEALAWIISRKVLINDQPITGLKEIVPIDGIVRIKEYYKRQYVNKGGLKLESALKRFHIDVKDKVLLDCGASTGGFTDCLIQNGAKIVYAVDVGFGQLAGKLLIDERVVNLERTNLADIILHNLTPAPDIISLDLSYLSLKKALPLCKQIMPEKGIVVALVKPIYEVESTEIRRSGKINDPIILRNVINNLIHHLIDNGYNIHGITFSPVTGNNGTLEFFIYLSWGNFEVKNINDSYDQDIELAVGGAFSLLIFDKNNYAKLPEK